MGEEADWLNEIGDCEHGEEAADRMDRDRLRKAREQGRAFRLGVKAEVARQLKGHGREKKEHMPRGKSIECVCLECKQKFTARVSDRKRGWAKCCSKSCASKWKDRVTGGRNREHYGY